MKYLLLILLIGCSGSNQHGKCVGIIEEGEPELEYKIDGWNLGWSIIGVQFILPPVLWATDYAKCPVGIKNKDNNL